MKSLLVSQDNFLASFLNQETNQEVVVIDKIEDFLLNGFNIFIFDQVQKNELNKVIDKINKICTLTINIANYQVDEVINLKPPFKLNTLKSHINTYIEYCNKFVLSKGNLVLNLNKECLVIDNTTTLNLTEKECKVLEILFNNDQVDKNLLLKQLCGYDESRAVDTIIYNIKSKLKIHQIADFIESNSKYYKIKV